MRHGSLSEQMITLLYHYGASVRFEGVNMRKNVVQQSVLPDTVVSDMFWVFYQAQQTHIEGIEASGAIFKIISK